MEPDSAPGDMTLLGQWRHGDQHAAAAFHDRYLQKLIRLVERNLAQRFSRRLDPEDVVQSVMRTVFARISDGRLAPDRSSDLWKLLCSIALCKVRNKVRYEEQEGRDIKRTEAVSSLEGLPDPTEQAAVDVIDLIETTARSLQPNEAAAMNLFLAGHNLEEIGRHLRVTKRSVIRYRDRIRLVLERVLDYSQGEF